AKQELTEIVDFLRDPEKYGRLGGRIPRGGLLSGSPGTGQTLLARAVAGEAGAPFFSMSASEFVEAIVGVGASRVRDLFRQAKQESPAIVFIDELDAVGRARSTAGGYGGGSDEREQTLNQILTEMDGFGSTTSGSGIGATNRIGVRDQALLRPGRFERRGAGTPAGRDGLRPGQALVGMRTAGAVPVRKLTIVPRGQSLGVALSSPDVDRFNSSRAELEARVKMALGGRAAEEVVFGDQTTGAEGDIAQVTALVRQMVGRWGMSP